MTRMFPSALAFAAGFGVVVAAVLALPQFEPGAPAAPGAVAEAAPWTQHRASVLLAQETAEMRALRGAGRMALRDVAKVSEPQ